MNLMTEYQNRKKAEAAAWLKARIHLETRLQELGVSLRIITTTNRNRLDHWLSTLEAFEKEEN